MLNVRHAVPRGDLLLGVIRAEHIAMNRSPAGLEEALATLVGARAGGLGESGEARRVAAREMLRNGSYKPTGRGKPANEYLLRAAAENEYTFPRINGPVDVCNYVSLKHVVPVSLWDLDRTGTRRYVFRLGLPEEGYVFNEGGQRIDVEDLLVGCRVLKDEDPIGEPIVNPVRDSLATKTTPDTSRVGACIYAPAAVFSHASLAGLCREFADLLSQCGERVQVAFGVAAPESVVDV